MKMTLKIFLAFVFLSLLILRPTPSYAWHGHDHSYIGVNFGVWPGSYYYGGPYYPYYADPYYAPAYYPGTVVVASSNYQPVVVNGVTYYVNNGVYYIYTQYGYQAVATPAAVSAPVIQTSAVTAAPATISSDDSFTINIPSSKGGYTSVVLKKSGNGFIGPQGEFYSEFPKVSQLQAMYGK